MKLLMTALLLSSQTATEELPQPEIDEWIVTAHSSKTEVEDPPQIETEELPDLFFRADLSGEDLDLDVLTNVTAELEITLDAFALQLRYNLKIQADFADNILGVNGAHLHCDGPDGPVIMTLAGGLPGGVGSEHQTRGTLTFKNLQLTECGTTLGELAYALLEGRVYADVHSLEDLDGEVSGQVMQVHESHQPVCPHLFTACLPPLECRMPLIIPPVPSTDYPETIGESPDAGTDNSD